MARVGVANVMDVALLVAMTLAVALVIVWAFDASWIKAVLVAGAGMGAASAHAWWTTRRSER